MTKLATEITMKVVSSLSGVNSWRNGIHEILTTFTVYWPAYKRAFKRYLSGVQLTTQTTFDDQIEATNTTY